MQCNSATSISTQSDTKAIIPCIHYYYLYIQYSKKFCSWLFIIPTGLLFDVEIASIQSVEFFTFTLTIPPKIHGTTEPNTHTFTGGVLAPVLVLESAALGGGLDNDAGLVTGEVPARLGQLFPLLLVDGQAGTGQGELDQEHQEQDDHVLSTLRKSNVLKSIQRYHYDTDVNI